MTIEDFEMRSNIKDVLTGAMSIAKATKIDVDVHDGIVTLNGNVPKDVHDQALDITKNIIGVKEVHDNMSISDEETQQ